MELYKFADAYRGLYHEAIRGTELYYESTDYGDELVWAAAWLFKATEDRKYLDAAERHYQQFHLEKRPNEFFYNKKLAGIQVESEYFLSFIFMIIIYNNSTTFKKLQFFFANLLSK